MISEKELWIGLAKLIPKAKENNLKLVDKGAYVNVIAYSTDAENFATTILIHFEKLQMDLIELEDVEQLSFRMSTYGISQELYKLAGEVKQKKIIGLGTFHTFPLDE